MDRSILRIKRILFSRDAAAISPFLAAPILDTFSVTYFIVRSSIHFSSPVATVAPRLERDFLRADYSITATVAKRSNLW